VTENERQKVATILALALSDNMPEPVTPEDALGSVQILVAALLVNFFPNEDDRESAFEIFCDNLGSTEVSLSVEDMDPEGSA